MLLVARYRRDLSEPEVPGDPARDFRRLGWLLAASDPPSPLRARLHGAARAIEARGGPAIEQLEEMWIVVDQLGLREAGERLLAHLQGARHRHGATRAS